MQLEFPCDIGVLYQDLEDEHSQLLGDISLLTEVGCDVPHFQLTQSKNL